MDLGVKEKETTTYMARIGKRQVLFQEMGDGRQALTGGHVMKGSGIST